CSDRDTCTEEQARELAQAAHLRQLAMLRSAAAHVAATLPEPPGALILSGSGEFLARKVMERFFQTTPRCSSLTRELGREISQAACAYAVAVLAAELETV